MGHILDFTKCTGEEDLFLVLPTFLLLQQDKTTAAVNVRMHLELLISTLAK